MKCEYCGRTNSDDGHGGCISCGASIPMPTPELNDWTCGTAVLNHGSNYTQLSRKAVRVSAFSPPVYTQSPNYVKREDDTPAPSITFAPLSSSFSAPTPDFSGSDFSGGGGDFGGGGASGSFGGDS